MTVSYLMILQMVFCCLVTRSKIIIIISHQNSYCSDSKMHFASMLRSSYIFLHPEVFLNDCFHMSSLTEGNASFSKLDMNKCVKQS